MKSFVKKMIEQHANAIIMLEMYNKFLHNAVNDNKSDKATVANVALIVHDLKNLIKDFETCLNNENVQFAPDGCYFEEVTSVQEIINKDDEKTNKL